MDTLTRKYTGTDIKDPAYSHDNDDEPPRRQHIDRPSESTRFVDNVEEDNDFFITQRGGKITQYADERRLSGIQNEKRTSVFEAAQGPRRTLQSTLLLQKKKEMAQVQQLLELKRIEFGKRMDECREKQEELRVKQKQIRERVIKFEKFLKENDAKRQRANSKALAEKRVREQKDQELSALQLQLKDEIAKAENVKHMITKYIVYERYLQSVVDVLPVDYLDVNEPHINDILMRHKTLVETNEDLIQTVQGQADQIEKEQTMLAGMVKEKNDQVLVDNSQMGTAQKVLDKRKIDCAYLEQKLEERDNSGKTRMRILGETKLAIDNIYDRVGVRNQNVAVTLTDKLSAIMERVLDLSHIASKAAESMTQNERTKIFSSTIQK